MIDLLPSITSVNTSVIYHRVTYSEVDRMSYVYYGNYTVWFEMGRTELLRESGLTYKQIEESGILLPVRKCNIRYHKPAKYDDYVSIATIVTSLKKASVVFMTAAYNEKNILLVEGEVELACTDKSGKPKAITKNLADRLICFMQDTVQ